jgi:hypothetical protein
MFLAPLVLYFHQSKKGGKNGMNIQDILTAKGAEDDLPDGKFH